jgi:ABC-type multidrug transport system ATPase subunit
LIRAQRLAKRFGDRRVFADVDIEVVRDELLLVTGPNGCGKTTLLRVLAGLAAPTAGDLRRPERGEIGFLAHEPLVYGELTAIENLTLFGRLYRVHEGRERAGMLLERFGLWDARHERVAVFSRGMRQRLALCRVLLHEPALLLLDEPSNALDEEGLALLDAMLAEPGRGAIVTSHDPERFGARATARLALA